ncbi:hypothetical protein JCM3775_006977 [Rhodotorula graminis]
MARYTLTAPEPHTQAPTWTARTPPLSRARVVVWFLLAVTFNCLVPLGWRYSTWAALVAVVLSSLSTRTTETITLLPSLGVQLSHKRDLALFPLSVSSHQRLLPIERISKVVINEGLQGARGKAYLAVVEGGLDEALEGETVHVVFESILPDLADLEPVRQAAQAMLKP